jgi:hypothetical protein
MVGMRFKGIESMACGARDSGFHVMRAHFFVLGCGLKCIIWAKYIIHDKGRGIRGFANVLKSRNEDRVILLPASIPHRSSADAYDEDVPVL